MGDSDRGNIPIRRWKAFSRVAGRNSQIGISAGRRRTECQDAPLEHIEQAFDGNGETLFAPAIGKSGDAEQQFGIEDRS